MFVMYNPFIIVKIFGNPEKCEKMFAKQLQQLAFRLFYVDFIFDTLVIAIQNLFYLCRCADSESSYLTCSSKISSLNGTSSLPSIPKKELLTTHTLVREGFELWYCIVVLVGMIITINMMSYVILRFIRKPKLA